ncbi:MAG: hypothetical protein AAGC45_08190 [Bacteroidota bacterium]
MLRIVLFLFLFPFLLFSQEDCFLGIGGKDDETIKAVFELTEDQVEKMRNWGAELEFRNEIFERRAKNLLKNHAQGSPEDLMNLSYEFKALLDSMENNIKRLDKRMLGIFTNEQYNLYIMLCNQVYRSPIYAVRSVNEK